MDISECLGAFPDKFPFARANVIAKHFRIAPGTIMEILQRDSGLKKFSRQSVPRQLSLSQKADPANRSRALQSSILSYIPPIVLYSSNNLTHHFSHEYLESQSVEQDFFNKNSFFIKRGIKIMNFIRPIIAEISRILNVK
jgi:hypothetical protein